MTPESSLAQADRVEKRACTSLKNSVLHFESVDHSSYLDSANAAAQVEGVEIQCLYLISTIEPAALGVHCTDDTAKVEDEWEDQLLHWLGFNTAYLDRLHKLDCIFVNESTLLRDSEYCFNLIRNRLGSYFVSESLPGNLNNALAQRQSQATHHLATPLETDGNFTNEKLPTKMNAVQKNLIAEALLEKIPALNQHDALTDEDKALASFQNSRRHASMSYTTYIDTKNTVIYISENSLSRGHNYRVSLMIQGLHYHGFDAFWLTPKDALQMKHLLDRATLVVLYRCTMNKEIEDIYARCRLNKIITAFDIDDYLFDREIINRGYFHYFSRLDDHDKRDWMNKIDGYRSQIFLADYCIAPTSTLGQAMRELNPNTIIAPNGYSPITARLSTRWAESKRSIRRDSVVMGYMSGTPTHDADFSQIADIVFRILNDNPNYILRIVGHLDMAPYLGQYPPEQVEVRPLVEHVNFSYELAMIDVLLVPLELNNPFCDAKSPLKWFESAIACTPSICAANPTYSDIIFEGVNGYLCSTPDDWKKAIVQLCSSPELRERISKQAEKDAAKFSIRLAVTSILSLITPKKPLEHDYRKLLNETN